MCYQEESIQVPKDEVGDMKELGATCGMCMLPPEGCCSDTPVIEGKIDMCTQTGEDINVSIEACRGILNSGGSCGTCPVEVEVIPEEEIIVEPVEVVTEEPVVEPTEESVLETEPEEGVV